MATEGPNFPGLGQSLSSGDANEVTWATPTNIQDADADEATCITATFDSPDPTYYLVGNQYGFAIPAGATIDGITVVVNRRSIIANSGIDREVRLRDANGALIGDDKADLVTVWPSSLTTKTYGGATDTWNTGLSNAQLLDMVNDPDFGVSFQAQANIANADIGVSYITVTINYTPQAPQEYTRTPADGIGFTDARTPSHGHTRTRADQLGLTDGTSHAAGAVRTTADGLALADQATPQHTPGGAPAGFTREIRLVL